MADTEETEGPKQTVRRMPGEFPGEDREVGPFFPSGMSAPEAALAGATEGMTDEEIAKVKGEEVATKKSAE